MNHDYIRVVLKLFLCFPLFLIALFLQIKISIRYVMRSMKRDHKSANVNFKIVEYIVDDCSTNIF